MQTPRFKHSANILNEALNTKCFNSPAIATQSLSAPLGFPSSPSSNCSTTAKNKSNLYLLSYPIFNLPNGTRNRTLMALPTLAIGPTFDEELEANFTNNMKNRRRLKELVELVSKSLPALEKNPQDRTNNQESRGLLKSTLSTKRQSQKARERKGRQIPGDGDTHTYVRSSQQLCD